MAMGYYRSRLSISRNRIIMIKYAEIYKIKIENEIRYVAKVYIDREEIEDESFSSSTFEETAKHILKDCVISNYFDMTEMEE